jgi:hypothetical protein
MMHHVATVEERKEGGVTLASKLRVGDHGLEAAAMEY